MIHIINIFNKMVSQGNSTNALLHLTTCELLLIPCFHVMLEYVQAMPEESHEKEQNKLHHEQPNWFHYIIHFLQSII
jgi:hypothetical protein